MVASFICLLHSFIHSFIHSVSFYFIYFPFSSFQFISFLVIVHDFSCLCYVMLCHFISFIHSLIHLICSFIHSFIHSFIQWFHSPMKDASLDLLIHSPTFLFMHQSFIHSFCHSWIHSFMYAFIQSCIKPFIQPHLVAQPFIQPLSHLLYMQHVYMYVSMHEGQKN